MERYWNPLDVDLFRIAVRISAKKPIKSYLYVCLNERCGKGLKVHEKTGEVVFNTVQINSPEKKTTDVKCPVCKKVMKIIDRNPLKETDVKNILKESRSGKNPKIFGKAPPNLKDMLAKVTEEVIQDSTSR